MQKSIRTELNVKRMCKKNFIKNCADGSAASRLCAFSAFAGICTKKEVAGKERTSAKRLESMKEKARQSRAERKTRKRERARSKGVRK